MYVVVWEPRTRAGGGHQLVMDRVKAERIEVLMHHKMPDAQISVLPAERYAAAAVVERERRGMRR